MSYINNLKETKGLLNKRQINSLKYELDKLLKMYPDVVISEIRSLEEEDTSGNEKITAGSYSFTNKVIKINVANFQHFDMCNKSDYFKKRKALRERLQRRL